MHCQSLLLDFNQDWIFSAYFRNILIYQISWISSGIRAIPCGQRDRRTDMTKKPKNHHWRLQVLRLLSCATVPIRTASPTLRASCGPQHLHKCPLGPLLTHNINTLTVLILHLWTLCDTWEKHSSLSDTTHTCNKPLRGWQRQHGCQQCRQH
jgi:hypothetical protein